MLCQRQSGHSHSSSRIKDGAGPHLLAIDPLQVEVVKTVDDEGAPQRQTDHGVTLRVDGQLVQTPHLSQGRQLEQTADVGFQEDQVLQEKARGFVEAKYLLYVDL